MEKKNNTPLHATSNVVQLNTVVRAKVCGSETRPSPQKNNVLKLPNSGAPASIEAVQEEATVMECSLCGSNSFYLLVEDNVGKIACADCRFVITATWQLNKKE